MFFMRFVGEIERLSRKCSQPTRAIVFHTEQLDQDKLTLELQVGRQLCLGSNE
jgi:hypothetical protein